MKQYHNIYADEIREIASHFKKPEPVKITFCIDCGERIRYTGKRPLRCETCKGMK